MLNSPPCFGPIRLSGKLETIEKIALVLGWGTACGLLKMLTGFWFCLGVRTGVGDCLRTPYDADILVFAFIFMCLTFLGDFVIVIDNTRINV